MTFSNSLQDDLPKLARKQLHAADLIHDQNVPPVDTNFESPNADALQTFDVDAVLGHADGPGMALGSQQCGFAVQRHNAKTVTFSPGPQILSVESSRAHAHGTDDLTNDRRFADARLAGDKERRFYRARRRILNARKPRPLTQFPATPAAPETRPWSPLAVTLITFFLPAGGAILTVRNLARLGSLRADEAKSAGWALVGIFGLGMGALLSLSPVASDGMPRLDPNLTSGLYLAITIAAYLAQRGAWISWRNRNPNSRGGPWLRAIGVALLYQVLAVIVAVPVYVILASVTGH